MLPASCQKERTSHHKIWIKKIHGDIKKRGRGQIIEAKHLEKKLFWIKWNSRGSLFPSVEIKKQNDGKIFHAHFNVYWQVCFFQRKNVWCTAIVYNFLIFQKICLNCLWRRAWLRCVASLVSAGGKRAVVGNIFWRFLLILSRNWYFNCKCTEVLADLADKTKTSGKSVKLLIFFGRQSSDRMRNFLTLCKMQIVVTLSFHSQQFLLI